MINKVYIKIFSYVTKIKDSDLRSGIWHVNRFISWRGGAEKESSIPQD